MREVVAFGETCKIVEKNNVCSVPRAGVGAGGWEPEVTGCISSTSGHCGQRGGRDKPAGLLLSGVPHPPPTPVPLLH